MTSCWSRISRAPALWLVLLGVSPFTAPFSTCSLTGVDNQPDGLPFERSIHKEPFAKLDAASDMSAALAAGVTAAPPALNMIGLATFQRSSQVSIGRCCAPSYGCSRGPLCRGFPKPACASARQVR